MFEVCGLVIKSRIAIASACLQSPQDGNRKFNAMGYYASEIWNWNAANEAVNGGEGDLQSIIDGA